MADNQMGLQEKERIIVDWAKTPVAERKQSKRGLAQKLGVGIQFIDDIVSEIPPQGDSYNSEKWLQERAPKMDEALTYACEKGNAAALLTYYKLTKRLVDQSEMKVKFELSADEFARIEQEARRRNREEGFAPGEIEVSQFSPVLLKEIREGEGQTQGNNPI